MMPDERWNSEAGYCDDCGFVLSGLTDGVCPECGRSPVPVAARACESDDHAKSFRGFAQAPSLWTIIPLVGFTLYALNDASVPGVKWADDLVYFFAFITGIVVLRDYWRRRNASRTVSAATGLEWRGRRRAWRWAVLPVCVLVLVSLRFVNWPLSMRFAMSRSGFELMQAKIDQGEPVPTHSIRVGLYDVWIKRVYGRTVYFTGAVHPSSGRGMGFMRGTSKHPVVRRCETLMGDWYVASAYPYERPDLIPATGRSPNSEAAQPSP